MRPSAGGGDAAVAAPRHGTSQPTERRGDGASENLSGRNVAAVSAELRAAVQELIADPRFGASARNRRFLAYVVEEELQGRGKDIRAYSVAVEVFRRPPDFDPSLDPIVRIEAGRLRQALARYYAEVSPAAAWQIVIPKGAYRPRFESLTPAASGHVPTPDSTWGLISILRRQPRALAGAIFAIAMAAAIALASAPRISSPRSASGPPAILIQPFAVLGGDADMHRLALGLTRDVVDRLSRFRSFEIFGPAVYQHALDGGPVDFAGVAQRLHAGYVVEGTLRQAGERLVVNVQLKEQATGRYLWTYRADSSAEGTEVLGAMFDMASQIAGMLGQPYGLVNRAEWLKSQPGSIDAYDCVLQAHEYYRSIDAQGHARVRDCLERAVAANPRYAAAWVMLAWVYLDEARYKLNPRPELYDAEAKAREAVDRALALDPEQEMGLSARSVLQFRAGDMAAFRVTGDRMIALNPNDPDLAVDYGARLALSGDWDAGMPLVRRALDLAVNPPGTYYMALAWDHYRLGDDDSALREAEKIAMPDFQLAVLTRTAIYGQLGMPRESATTLANLRRLRPDLAEDPRPWLLELHFEPTFADRLAEGVRKAARLAAQP